MQCITVTIIIEHNASIFEWNGETAKRCSPVAAESTTGNT